MSGPWPFSHKVTEYPRTREVWRWERPKRKISFFTHPFTSTLSNFLSCLKVMVLYHGPKQMWHLLLGNSLSRKWGNSLHSSWDCWAAGRESPKGENVPRLKCLAFFRLVGTRWFWRKDCLLSRGTFHVPGSHESRMSSRKLFVQKA